MWRTAWAITSVNSGVKRRKKGEHECHNSCLPAFLEKLFPDNRVSTFSTAERKLVSARAKNGKRPDDHTARSNLSWLQIADARPQNNNYVARVLQRE